MKLTNPTDREIDAAFAEKVAGWMQCERLGRMVWYDPSGGHEILPPRFTENADLILPFLDKEVYWNNTFNSGAHMKVDERNWMNIFRDGKEHEAHAGSFPRAAVIALLSAHGADIEFT